LNIKSDNRTATAHELCVNPWYAVMSQERWVGGGGGGGGGGLQAYVEERALADRG